MLFICSDVNGSSVFLTLSPFYHVIGQAYFLPSGRWALLNNSFRDGGWCHLWVFDEVGVGVWVVGFSSDDWHPTCLFRIPNKTLVGGEIWYWPRKDERKIKRVCLWWKNCINRDFNLLHYKVWLKSVLGWAYNCWRSWRHNQQPGVDIYEATKVKKKTIMNQPMPCI